MISFIVGIILLTGTSSAIAYSFGANQVGYTPNDTNWQVTTVADAINDLYLKKVGDNYSTDEKVVGTWIDGRPVYQKTYYYNSVTNGMTIDNSLNSTNVEIINVTGNAYQGTYVWSFPVSNTSWFAALRIDDSKISVETSFTLTDTTIIIQYTKTTDSIPNQNNQG